MKIQRKIWNYILIFVLGMMGMITIIFFLVEIAGGREMLYTAECNYDCFDVMRVLADSIDNSGMSVRKAD